ncbi:uncharacterized protein LOC134789836 [Cydia splendana]|uniref:uncharacterized protein LOC134789836 n=1 Tax=Cydia splendana TaxID=1100963 RepID=UPI002140CAB0
MNTLSAKLKDFFLNLKTDAVPRPPRNRPVEQDTPPEENNENYDPNNEEPEVIVIEEPDDDLKKEKNKKSKSKKDFYKEETKGGKPYKQEKRKSDCIVNTQSTGNVINIVNSKDVRWGDDYYMGSAKPSTKNMDPEEEEVEKCNLITLLMESKQKPIQHEYLDQISGNLGKNWYGLFIALGFLKGKIETMEINTRDYGVTEARYKLLLDWTNNDEDGTLGGLTKKLWDHGDRALVKQLAIMYNKNKNK